MDHDHYIQYRESLVKVEFEAIQTQDKYIVTLSSAAFGISLTALTDLFPVREYLWLLIAAWTSFGISILAVVLSIRLSVIGARKMREKWDEIYRSIDEDKGVEDVVKIQKTSSNILEVLNWISCLTFVSGVWAFAIFACCNTYGLDNGRYTTSGKVEDMPTSTPKTPLEKGGAAPPPPKAPPPKK